MCVPYNITVCLAAHNSTSCAWSGMLCNKGEKSVILCKMPGSHSWDATDRAVVLMKFIYYITPG
jgi:hypothetical protein